MGTILDLLPTEVRRKGRTNPFLGLEGEVGSRKGISARGFSLPLNFLTAASLGSRDIESISIWCAFIHSTFPLLGYTNKKEYASVGKERFQMTYFKSIFPLKESKKAFIITVVGAHITAGIVVFFRSPKLASLIAVVSIFWATSQLSLPEWKVQPKRFKIAIGVISVILAIAMYCFFWKQFSSVF